MTEQLSSLTDEKLLVELRQDNTDAFDVVVKRYKDPLTACAQWLVGPGGAPAVVVNVFLKLYFTRPGARRTRKLSTWLYGETLRLARSSRSRRRHVSGTVESWLRGRPSSQLSNPLNEYLHRELNRDGDSSRVQSFRRELESLPEQLREILVLRDFLDLPPGEIGGILHMSESKVDSRAEKARAALSKNLQLPMRK
ncbi:MAG: RNA polymerase sigma factor [Bacteroidetes bacterium]|nr:RNA polymerase sigma factor [Bacteroidota bacterium]